MFKSEACRLVTVEKYRKSEVYSKFACRISHWTTGRSHANRPLPGGIEDGVDDASAWHDIKPSMSRRRFATRAQATSSIFEWVEGWYNRRRRRSALGYVSPEEFEASLN
ncbi:MAG TPA: IS3 family transposase [Tepidisphaeraceae bacterium]|nr:IS3 family transposase [Tepidisphaeraceae bacterium]